MSIIADVKQIGYLIIAGTLLLVALGLSKVVSFPIAIEQDKSAMLSFLNNDERTIISAINAISGSQNTKDLGSIEQVLSRLPKHIAYQYQSKDGELLSWVGNLEDCHIVKSKQIPGGSQVTIGWEAIDENAVFNLPVPNLQGIYLASQDGTLILKGNEKNLVLIYKEAAKRPVLKWLSIICLLLSFLFFLYFASQQDIRLHCVLVPVGYILYYTINSLYTEGLTLFNDASLMLTSWANSPFDLVLLTIAFFAFFSGNLMTQEDKPSLSYFGEAISTVFLFTAVILSFYQFVQSPSVDINFNELSSISIIEGVSLVCIVSWTLLIFIRSQLLIHLSGKLGQWMKYGGFVSIAIIIMLIGSSFAGIKPIWLLPLFILTYLTLSDLYYDIGAKNITWLILWLVVISGFLSILLFGFDYQKDIKNKEVILSSYYHAFDDDIFQDIKSLHGVKQNTFLEKIEDHPSLGIIDKADLIENSFGQLDHLTIELTGTLENGMSIYSDQTFLANPTSNSAVRVLEGNWQFDPINNSYIFSTTVESSKGKITHEIAYQRYKSNSDFDLPLTIIRDGNILRNDLNLENSEIIAIQNAKAGRLLSNQNVFLKFKPYEDTVLITSKPILSILKPITLFSFFFCLLTFLVILFMLINSVWKFLPEFLPLRFGSDTSLSTRIQIIIVGMVIFSFIAIATITSIYLQNQIRNNKNIEIEQRINTVSNNLHWYLKDESDEPRAPYILENIRPQLELIHRTNIDIYGKYGASVNEGSQLQIPYLAYYFFNKLQQDDALTLKSDDKELSYFPIKSNQGSVVAYASLHHKEDHYSTLGVIDYLGTLLNVYVFLFLIAGAVALAIARSITDPLETLATRMTQIKLNRKNNPVNWKADDEIGKLINNYNVMIDELEDSAKLIAKTERDGAWKEMARNVAHEIKNPLTPMKLSIQYLERAVSKDPEQALPLVRRISNTLIEQIDNLAEIAGAFSNFGKMPQATNEKVNLNEVVETNHDLFRKRDDMDISLSIPIEDHIVFADKNHIISILNNIVKNAIQSIPNDRRGKIAIALYKEEENAIIKVTDNGIGIPDAEKNKIFRPNFTTKSSGSGLGLAISANMIEVFNGSLYFESQENKGSKFYISIPLMKQYQQNTDSTKVSLD